MLLAAGGLQQVLEELGDCTHGTGEGAGVTAEGVPE